MSHLLRLAFQQNPNVGLESFANDRFCLVPRTVSPQQEKEISEVLRVPLHRTNLCGTSLLGVFAAGNNHMLLLPPIVTDDELHHFDQLRIPYHILETDYTALGNLLVANDHACLISPLLEPHKAEIKKALRVSSIRAFALPDIEVSGSLAVLNDKGILLSAFASERDAAHVQELFGLPVARGTVNLGSPFVRSGITVNAHGFLFGSRTGGPEAIHIDQALGFLE